MALKRNCAVPFQCRFSVPFEILFRQGAQAMSEQKFFCGPGMTQTSHFQYLNFPLIIEKKKNCTPHFFVGTTKLYSQCRVVKIKVYRKSSIVMRYIILNKNEEASIFQIIYLCTKEDSPLLATERVRIIKIFVIIFLE